MRNGPAVARVSVNGSTSMRTPYTDQVSVGVQRRVRTSTAVTVDLVRALGAHLPVGGDLNYPDPATHARPDPTLDQIIVTQTRGQSWYTGLQASVTQQLPPRYAYSVGYTWSSSENDTDGRAAFPQDETRLLDDRGPAANDARHRVTASGTLNLPFACRLSTVVTASSALPYNITTGPNDKNLDGVSGNERPDGVGRNSARGSAYFGADIRFSKTFGSGRRRLEMLIEAFNATNHANWSDYNGVQGNLKYGLPTNAGPPRQLQLGARWNF
jgi:hypothetical protein